MKYLINLLEKDKVMNEELKLALVQEGWFVRTFCDDSYAMAPIGESSHLWIINIQMPGLNGLELISEIKESSPGMPIISITEHNSGCERIAGLEAGSDDCISKPFLPREIVLRAGKLLQRTYGI